MGIKEIIITSKNAPKKYPDAESKEGRDVIHQEPRVIPICEKLWVILKDIPQAQAIHDTHLFQYRGNPLADVRAILRKACKEAGLVYGQFKKGGFIFHDLRHTFNTNMRKAGVAESVIMAITGHSTRAMFDRYNVVAWMMPNRRLVSW